jgi:hypothetical protein
MEALDLEPRVVANGSAVAFALPFRDRTVECTITVTTLQTFFWLGPRASEAQTLKTFRDGYGRIRAIAERKLLAHPAATLELTPDDFARP